MEEKDWTIGVIKAQYNYSPTGKRDDQVKELITSQCGMTMSFFINSAVELIRFQDRTFIHSEYDSTFEHHCNERGFQTPQFRFIIKGDRVLVWGEYMFKSDWEYCNGDKAKHKNDWQQFYPWFRDYLLKETVEEC